MQDITVAHIPIVMLAYKFGIGLNRSMDSGAYGIAVVKCAVEAECCRNYVFDQYFTFIGGNIATDSNPVVPN